jgi:membrane protein involved in colicin uptake
MTNHNYPELVAQAEKAVAAVKDPDLKRIAFQKVLDDLLGAGSDGPRKGDKVGSTNRKPGRKAESTSTPKGGPKAYVEELIEEGFFDKPKSIAQVKAELENRGHHIPITSLSGPLQKFCQKKKLRRQKLPTSGTYTYSIW